MSAVAIGAIVAGTALTVYGNYKESQAQEEAARAKAEAKRAQAFEILGRSETNIKRLELEAGEFRSTQQAAIVRGGLDISASLVQVEQFNKGFMDMIADQKREAMFKAEQLLMGADLDLRLASDIASVRNIQAAGTIVGGAGRAANASK